MLTSWLREWSGKWSAKWSTNWAGKRMGFGAHSTPEPVLTPDQRDALAVWRALPPAALDRPHADCRYVVVDVESSGLNMQRDRLISIGAVAVVDGRIDPHDAFQVVLRQAQVSSNENILIHGIGGSAQAEGVEPADALLAFLAYAGRSPFVAYHAFFDEAMIDQAMRRYLGLSLRHTWIDLAWVLPDFFSFRSDTRIALDDWLQHFGIDNILRHNAVSDAFATARLLQIVLSAARRKGAETPLSLQRIEKARRWMYESR